MRNFFGIFLLMFIFCSQLSAQKQLTLEDFFVDGTFRTKGVYGLRSMNDGEHYTVLENNGTRIVKYSYKTGLPVATLLDLKTLEDSPVSRIDDYTFEFDVSDGRSVGSPFKSTVECEFLFVNPVRCAVDDVIVLSVSGDLTF